MCFGNGLASVCVRVCPCVLFLAFTNLCHWLLAVDSSPDLRKGQFHCDSRFLSVLLACVLACLLACWLAYLKVQVRSSYAADLQHRTELENLLRGAVEEVVQEVRAEAQERQPAPVSRQKRQLFLFAFRRRVCRHAPTNIASLSSDFVCPETFPRANFVLLLVERFCQEKRERSELVYSVWTDDHAQMTDEKHQIPEARKGRPPTSRANPLSLPTSDFCRHPLAGVSQPPRYR